MAFNEKEQAIIKWGIENGKSMTEIKDAVRRYRTTGSPADPSKTTVTTPPKQDFLYETGADVMETVSAVGNQFGKAGEDIVKTATDTKLNPLEKFIQGTAQAFRGGARAFGETVIGAGKALLPQEAEEAVGKTVQDVGSVVAQDPNIQKLIANYNALDPETKRNVDNALGFAEGLAEIVTGGATSRVAKPVIETATSVASSVTKNVAKTADEAFSFGANLRGKVQALVGEKSVSPQLKASAERLFAEGTKRLEDPVATYDKYVTQAKKSISDIKQDSPVSLVGENIGDAFGSLVKQRRIVGGIMANELKTVGGVKTDILPVQDNFVKTLSGEGLSYDRLTRQISQKVRQSKMSSEDVAILERYATELQRLGSKPTLKELDAFMSRIPREIEVYKSSKNLIGSTNAERIIKQSLAELRKQFDPTTTGNKALEAYSNARSTYAELSDFIEEGSQYLGKVTQSGDFAKDASLAKSAVQSVLNNGKKDWLIELEALTGYPAVDEAVLALQAMKDAGDFRGLSLLQTLSTGSVPTSKTGFTQAVLDYAVSTGQKLVAGTPEEQTRAFLKSLVEKSSQGTSQ